jgi:hypothetical protein
MLWAPFLAPSHSLNVTTRSYITFAMASFDRDRVPPKFMLLASILHRIGGFDFLKAFVDEDDDDSKLLDIKKMKISHVIKVYGMPADLAVKFAEELSSDRVNQWFSLHSRPPQIDGSASLSERHNWLRAILIFEACTSGLRLLVGDVMERLHKHIVKEVKSSIMAECGSCEDADWNCATCVLAKDEHFTESSPVVLKIRSMDCNGIAVSDTLHHLKPGTMTSCVLKNVPVDLLGKAVTFSSKTCLCIYPAGSEYRSRFVIPSSFVLLHPLTLDSSKPHLTPFRVLPSICFGRSTLPAGWRVLYTDDNEEYYLCDRTGQLLRSPPPVDCPPETSLYAVLCSSCPGRTRQLVYDHLKDAGQLAGSLVNRKLLQSFGGCETFAFWSLGLLDSGFHEVKHSLKAGTIISFESSSGDSGSAPPPPLVEGSRYVVTESTDFSFKIAGPIVCPLSPFKATPLESEPPPISSVQRSQPPVDAATISTPSPVAEATLESCADQPVLGVRALGIMDVAISQLQSDLPFCVVRRSPVARFRDAARKYHARGHKAEFPIFWSGIRANLLSSHHGQFCKLFCSQTSRDCDFFEASDFDLRGTENPEQLLNMVALCKAFDTDSDCAIFRSLFPEYRGDFLTQTLISLKHAIVGVSSKTKKESGAKSGEVKVDGRSRQPGSLSFPGIRDFRNMLMHRPLKLASSDFDVFYERCVALNISVERISRYCSDGIMHRIHEVFQAVQVLKHRDFSRGLLEVELDKAAAFGSGGDRDFAAALKESRNIDALFIF